MRHPFFSDFRTRNPHVLRIHPQNSGLHAYASTYQGWKKVTVEGPLWWVNAALEDSKTKKGLVLLAGCWCYTYVLSILKASPKKIQK